MKKILAAIAATAAMLFVVGGSTPAESSQRTSHKKVVYLTFDDGPGPNTMALLNVMDRYDAKGTFFLKGINVEKNPGYVERYVERGHVVANHTYSHPHLDQLQYRSQVVRELEKGQEALGKYATSCFRPPFFGTTRTVKNIAAEMGLEQIMNDVNPKDWTGETPDVIYDTVVREVFDGAIVVFHGETRDRRDTVDALRLLLPKLESMGYEMKTLPNCKRVE